jgi:ferritin-like metal-binding protein YciE
MRLENLRELYVHELNGLHDSETQLIEALPKLAARASSPRLAKLLESHLDESRRHRERLERIFEELGEEPSGVTCEGMRGIVSEGAALLDAHVGDGPTIDAGLLTMVARTGHYEIAGYEALRQHAAALGFEEHARLLRQSLDEEGAAHRRLGSLADVLHREEAAASIG